MAELPIVWLREVIIGAFDGVDGRGKWVVFELGRARAGATVSSLLDILLTLDCRERLLNMLPCLELLTDCIPIFPPQLFIVLIIVLSLLFLELTLRR